MEIVTIAYILISCGVLFAILELFISTKNRLVLIGAAAVAVGVGLLYYSDLPRSATLAMLSSFIIIPGVIASLPYSNKRSRRLIPDSENDVTVAQIGLNPALEELKGRVGRAVSLLRPSGVVDIDGRRIDCITEGMMVEPGQWVKCVAVQANKVVVRPTDEPKGRSFESGDFS